MNDIPSLEPSSMEVFGARASAVRQILNVADGLAVDSSPFSSNHTPSEDSELNTSDVFEGAPSQTKCNPPELSHRVQHDSSILALAVSEHLIYAGTQDGEILVWSLATYELVIRIQAHRRAVLCLFLSPDGSLLWSSGGDAIVNAWCPKNLKRLYHLYSTYDVGDCFSVAYSTQFETVYIGAQNTSIQWCNLKDSSSRPTPDGERHPEKRNHRFFDSVNASGGRSTPRPAPSALLSEDGDILEIDKAHMMHYAHFGYVYCMLLVRNVSRLVEADNDMLISGGGDGTIKLWRLNNDPDHGLEEIAQLGDDDAESVLSLAIDGSFLYSGKLEGCVELWDLDTKQRLRVIKAHRGDIMTLQMGWGFLWSAGSTGFARKYSTVQYGKYKSTAESVSQKYQCLKRWKSHDGKVLASACTRYGSQQLYITGANDSSVSIWNMNDCQITANGVKDEQEDMLIKSLRDFVAFKTVSSRPDHAEDCRKGATFLMRLFKRYGAYTEMLNTDNSHNPIVFARFNGNPATSRSRRRVLFYGHYDVVPADDRKGNWIVPPFEMKGVNGYVYGRGVSDNKGPILAALYGVLDCLDEKALDADVVFLIEGEEESGSRGFQDAVRRHKDLIGEIDYILLANSYWLTDDVPCLTYGLRGVLHATIRVDSSHPDVHSGVDGSYMMDEPLSDLTAVLAKLKGLHNRILIPGFYDNVLPLTEAEEARYGDITDTLLRRDPELGSAETLKASLMARWREPNLTIHRYKVSGPDGSLVSGQASATISLRLVPNQEVDEVIKSLMSFVETSFATLDTHNHLTVTIDNQADPWLGDPDNEIFQTLEEAIVKVWGPIGESRRGSTAGTKPSRKMTNGASPSVKPTPATTLTLTNGSDHTSLASSSQESEPDRTISEPRKGRRPLYIREGGSIPSIRFLEKEFRAPAAHLPCGQASDSAHLDNERLRLSNLYKSREIFKYVFKELSRK